MIIKPFPFDFIVVFGGLLSLAFLVLAIIGIFSSSKDKETMEDEE